MQIVFSGYLLSWIFWPQAISVHPYLYDQLLVAPLITWIIMSLAAGPRYRRHFSLWFLVMIGMITFNLTQVAQAAHCADCFYP